MGLIRIAPPTVEPVSLADAKAHMRIVVDDHDAKIASLIVSARELCEHDVERALITQTWERVLNAFPDGEIELGVPPILSVVSVKYLDTSGVEQTLSAANYVLDKERDPGYVAPAVGKSWPATQTGAINAVRVRFTCGFGPAAVDVPEALKTWICMRVAADFFNREATTERAQAELPGRHVDRLLDRWRWLA